MTQPLKWIPLPIIQQLGPPAGLKDFQVGWFWNLFWASLKTESPGYLPMSDDLWMLSGALTRERWNANSSAVLAAFEIVELSGHGRLLFFPPLKSIIEGQLDKLRGKKSRTPGEFSEVLTDINKRVGVSSLSLFDFDVGSKPEMRKENQSERPKCGRCNDSGLRASYSKPGKQVLCECQEAASRKSLRQ